MSIRLSTPCDFDGICPYDVDYSHPCEYWRGAEELKDYPEDWDQEEREYRTDDCDYEMGFNPYMGCFTDDC